MKEDEGCCQKLSVDEIDFVGRGGDCGRPGCAVIGQMRVTKSPSHDHCHHYYCPAPALSLLTAAFECSSRDGPGTKVLRTLTVASEDSDMGTQLTLMLFQILSFSFEMVLFICRKAFLMSHKNTISNLVC